MSRGLIRWAIVCGVIIVALIVLSMAWGSVARFFPWTAQHRLANAEARATTAESDASARGLEVTGQATIAGRVDTFHHEMITVQDATTQAVTEARSAPDANEPLAADRADRLRRLDASLCAARAGLCAPAPADAPR